MAIFLVLGLGIVGVVSAQELTRGEPDLDVYLPNNEVSTGTAGEAATLEFHIQNDGILRVGSQRERVTTAQAVTVEIDDAGPFEAKTQETPVGSIADGATATAAKEFDIPSDIEPGEYDITVRVRYSYTSQVSDAAGSAQDRSTSTRQDVTVRVINESVFEIVDASADAEPGGTGTAHIDVRNTGDESVSAMYGTLSPAGEGALQFDGGTGEVFIGSLEPDETTTVAVDISVADGVSDGPKPFSAAFTYTDESGIERDATPTTQQLTLAESQAFSIVEMSDTLAVGYDGLVTGELQNDGPRTITDAVLVAEPMSDSLFVEDTRYALPTLPAGETTTFAYPTDVSGQADAGPRQFRFFVEYSSGDSTIEYGPINERVVIDDEFAEFSLEPINATVPVGGSAEIRIRITNERPETLSNIDGLLYTDNPLSAPNNEAFVPELAPGESAEMRFELAAQPEAMAEPRPVELDFEYETERGDTTLSDAYTVGVEIVENEDLEDDGSGFVSIPALIGIIVILGLGAAAYTYYRRNN